MLEPRRTIHRFVIGVNRLLIGVNRLLEPRRTISLNYHGNGLFYGFDTFLNREYIVY